jgi:hypothetical protein
LRNRRKGRVTDEEKFREIFPSAVTHVTPAGEIEIYPDIHYGEPIGELKGSGCSVAEAWADAVRNIESGSTS